MRRSFSSIVDLVGQVLEERRHVQRREARLAAVLGVERRHPDETVDSPLGGQQPVRVAPADDERRRQDAGFSAFGDLVDLDVESPPLRPAQVHAQHHLGPVLRVGPAGAGVDLRDGVALVVLAGEQGAQLELVERALATVAAMSVELALEPGELTAAFLERHDVQRLGVCELGIEGSQALDVVADTAVLGGHLPRLVGVGPQVGLAYLGFELSEALDQVVEAQVALCRVEARPQ